MNEHSIHRPSVRILWIAPERVLASELSTKLVRAGASVSRLSNTRAALEALSSPDLVPPHCILLDRSVTGLQTLLLALRAHPTLAHIPVVYVSPTMDARVLDEAQTIGADDVYWAADEGYLPALIRQLDGLSPEERPSLNGNAVFILHSSQEQRRRVGRVYRKAGFQVVFGSNEGELVRYVGSGAPLQVVVASSALLGGGADEVERLRTVIGRPELPWVLLDEGEDDPLLAGAQGANGIAAMGEDSPTENVLFLTNELLAGAQTSARGSRRLLFNGLCAFRTGRTLAYRHASLYNISRTGLYVRTLVPLPKGETVHLEMALPEGECLHLSGVVAWSRGAADGGQLAPPGFGVQLLASQCAPTELDAYVRAYEVLAARHQASARRRSGARRNAVEITTDVPDAHSA